MTLSSPNKLTSWNMFLLDNKDESLTLKTEHSLKRSV